MKNKLLCVITAGLIAFGAVGHTDAFFGFDKKAIVAKAETVEFTLSITPSLFNSASYAENNNEKTITVGSGGKSIDVGIVSNQVMLQKEAIQFQKNNGYIYNTTKLGTITSVTVTSTAGSFNTYYGSSEHPTSGTDKSGGFFTVKVGGATGTVSSIEVVFTIDYSTPVSAHDKFMALNTETSLAVNFSREGNGILREYEMTDFNGCGQSGGGKGGNKTLGDISFSSTNWYGTGTELRIYSGGSFTISCNDPITRIVMTGPTGSNSVKVLSVSTGTKTMDGETELTWTGSATSITFTASAQAKIRGLNILTGELPTYNYSNVALRFGIQYSNFPASIYNDLVDESGDSSLSFGIAVCKGATWTEAASVSGSKPYVPAAKDADNDGVADAYQYAMVLNGITNYAQQYVAKAFIQIGDTRYYAKATTAYSVNSIAASYVKDHSSETVVAENIGMLKDLSTATYKA